MLWLLYPDSKTHTYPDQQLANITHKKSQPYAGRDRKRQGRFLQLAVANQIKETVPEFSNPMLPYEWTNGAVHNLLMQLIDFINVAGHAKLG